jgi:hypothetical protein
LFSGIKLDWSILHTEPCFFELGASWFHTSWVLKRFPLPFPGLVDFGGNNYPSGSFITPKENYGIKTLFATSTDLGSVFLLLLLRRKANE